MTVWEQSVVSQTVDDAGTATTVLTFTGSNGDEEVQQVTLVMTAARTLDITVEGPRLDGFQARSTA